MVVSGARKAPILGLAKPLGWQGWTGPGQEVAGCRLLGLELAWARLPSLDEWHSK